MDNQRLWQHRSKEEDKEAILSLNLLERANVPKEKTLKCIYAVSNHIEEHYREVFILKKQRWQAQTACSRLSFAYDAEKYSANNIK